MKAEKGDIVCSDCGRVKSALAKFYGTKVPPIRCKPCYSKALAHGHVPRSKRSARKTKIFSMWGD